MSHRIVIPVLVGLLVVSNVGWWWRTRDGSVKDRRVALADRVAVDEETPGGGAGDGAEYGRDFVGFEWGTAAN